MGSISVRSGVDDNDEDDNNEDDKDDGYVFFLVGKSRASVSAKGGTVALGKKCGEQC